MTALRMRLPLEFFAAMLVAIVQPGIAFAAGGKFPVTVEHALGSTTVPAAPRRVVSLGYNDQDFLYALDIPPVGVTEWWGSRPFATWPWAMKKQQELGATPVVFHGSEIDLEWVLARDPDLIVAGYRDLDLATYEQLSRIAPVIAAPAGYPAWRAPWQAQLRLFALAVSGTTAKADAIVDRLQSGLSEIRRRNPQFQGKSAGIADLRAGQFVLWSSDAPVVRFMSALGFRFPASLDAKADGAGWIRLSLEQARLLDFDVLVWPNDVKSEVEAIRAYRNLRLFTENRSIWIEDETLSAAIWFQTPLSIEYVINKLPPRLAAAVENKGLSQTRSQE